MIYLRYSSLLILIFFFYACNDDLEMVSEVTIAIQNESLYNTDDFSVKAGIVFLESDDQMIFEYDKSDISNGGMVNFHSVPLNVGNYYVRYQFFVGNSFYGDLRHKPFQVNPGGEDLMVNVVY